MHLDDETIQRLLDPAVPASVSTRAEAHLRSCAECRSKLAEAKRDEAWTFEQFRHLDHPAPQASVQTIVARSARKFYGWQRLAAGIVLAIGVAGIAYAAPGSPLPGLFDRVIGLVRPARAPILPSSRIQPRQPDQAGIAVDPGERLTIVLPSRQTPDTAVVSLIDGNEVVVRALGGTTTFDWQETRLQIRHSGAAARFDIAIPRNAHWVELKAGERSLLVKRDSQVTADVAPDSGGRYRLLISGPLR
jgi:hypothetical protein